MDELRFREATIDDVEFLATASSAADRLPGGSGDGMYERVFGMTREECDQFLVETLAQETKDNQLTYRTFNLLTCDSRPIGCCAAWVEAQGGQPSGLKIALAVSRFLGGKRWRECASSVATLVKCSPKRTPGALQLETFYVDPAFRGRGVTGRLIDGVVAKLVNEGQTATLLEISLLKENRTAAAAYAKSRFEVAWSTSEPEEPFFALTGSRGFLQMKRVLG